MGTYLLLYGHSTAQVNGELPDIDEGMLVGDLGVQGVHLRQRPLHEVDHGQHVGRSKSRVLHKGDVHLLLGKEDNILVVRTKPVFY